MFIDTCAPSVNILVAFCSEMPLISSRSFFGVYATDSTVLYPPSMNSWMSRFVRPAMPYALVSCIHARMRAVYLHPVRQVALARQDRRPVHPRIATHLLQSFSLWRCVRREMKLCLFRCSGRCIGGECSARQVRGRRAGKARTAWQICRRHARSRDRAVDFHPNYYFQHSPYSSARTPAGNQSAPSVSPISPAINLS